MPRIKDNLKEFLQIKNQTETSCDLYFYGDIVSSWWGAWDDTDQYPEAVRDFLNEAKGKDLNIHINSGGGSVFAGITIYNMIKNHVGNKVVYIDGIAASIASVIALAGDRIIMRTGTSFMIHKPMFCLWDMYNSDDLRKMATDLDSVQECIMQVYKENIKDGVDISEIEDMVNKETWLTSEQMKNYFNVEFENEEAIACISDMFDKYKHMPKNLSNKKNIIDQELKDRLQIELELLD